MNPLAKLFRDDRESRGIRQRELAERLGHAPCYICSIEAGRKLPTDAYLQRYAEVLKLEALELEKLRQALELSKPLIRIPRTARPETYELCARLERKLETLTGSQADFLIRALEFCSRYDGRSQEAPIGATAPTDRTRTNPRRQTM